MLLGKVCRCLAENLLYISIFLNFCIMRRLRLNIGLTSYLSRLSPVMPTSSIAFRLLLNRIRLLPRISGATVKIFSFIGSVKFKVSSKNSIFLSIFFSKLYPSTLGWRVIVSRAALGSSPWFSNQSTALLTWRAVRPTAKRWE